MKNNPKDRVFISLFKAIAKLPWRSNRILARFFATLLYWFPSKTKKTIRRNLELCFPALEKSERNSLAKQTFSHSVYQFFEFAYIWLNPAQVMDPLVSQVKSSECLSRYADQKIPVIVAVPHLGNWEFIWHWIQQNYPSCGMYSPAKTKALDQIMLHARTRLGGKASGTDPKGLIQLMKNIKNGDVMMILPDQAPRLGAGIYTPFFGYPAYTMTLLHRFIEKTGAKLLWAVSLRSEDALSFEVEFIEPDFDYAAVGSEVFNRGMNRQIETLLKKAPAQYQWTYKRFKRQPEGHDFYRNQG